MKAAFSSTPTVAASRISLPCWRASARVDAVRAAVQAHGEQQAAEQQVGAGTFQPGHATEIGREPA
ncbi:hypothetical protein ETD86_26760 [Nonomuraea turkmeniaca]|uniref:Uncharacterized protein n=1 Tax=Nonomuraea turkmeniaca TaxID=103838 RepID=A0A5S4FDD0_9ACTN|nr:hypothetical protein [Nonomuraea turkmeniaca]TMR15671.1 hypothetical protein ETD86_26760 [Nonomuraea turkmeniaca]